jgi:hypothetical protein
MDITYRICISSPPDREKVVAEIFFGDYQWAELSKEGSESKLELYPKPTGETWVLPLNCVEQALAEAKKRLFG